MHMTDYMDRYKCSSRRAHHSSEWWGLVLKGWLVKLKYTLESYITVVLWLEGAGKGVLDDFSLSLWLVLSLREFVNW